MQARVAVMEPRVGRVVNGAIVLEDGDDLTEGAAVVIWIGDSTKPVTVEDEELERIDQGLEAAAQGELIDARAFLERLRQRG